MYLAIYAIGNKRYFGFLKKLSDKITMTNENFETVVLTKKERIKSYKFDSFADFKRVIPEIKQYGFRMYVVRTIDIKDEKESIKFFAELMRNPFYNLIIEERELKELPLFDDDKSKIIELKAIDDWYLAEKEFDFKSDFVKNIFDFN